MGWAAWLLLALAVGARAPMLRLWLCGEEGNFASAVRDVSRLRKPRLLIARNLDGKEFKTVPGHNLGGYAVPALLAGPVRSLARFRTDAQRTRYALLLRACFLLLWTLALALAARALPKGHALEGVALLTACSLFPLPLLGSVQIQYDGAVSTLLLTALCVLLTLRGERPIAWALAGLLISIGKLEFALVGLGTAIVTALVQRRGRGLAAFVAALVLGGLACWLIDADNFTGGSAVPLRFWGIEEQSGQPLPVRMREYLTSIWPLVWPVLIAAPVGALGFLASPARRRAVAPLAATLGVCGGYAVIAWQGDGFPRYFAPAFVLAPLALVLLEPPRWLVGAVAAAALAVAAPQYVGELERGPGAMCLRLHGSDLRPSLRRSPLFRPSCVPATSSESAPGFYSATAPFACCWAQWADWPELQPQLCP
jgi:hypothetical protein